MKRKGWQVSGLSVITLACGLFLGFVSVLPPPTVCRSAEGLAPGGGAPPKTLTIEQAVAYGLGHNRSVRAAEISVGASGDRIRESRADFYPRLDSRYEFSHFDEQPYMKVMDQAFPISHNNLNHWELELSQPLFMGHALTSQLNVSRLDRDIAKYRLEDTRLGLSQAVQRAYLQVLLSEKLLDVARENLKSQKSP